jgi:hypothetical protein
MTFIERILEMETKYLLALCGELALGKAMDMS